MPGSAHGPSIKNSRVYEALRRKGYDKARAAAISNAMRKGGYGSTYLALMLAPSLRKEGKERDYTRDEGGKFSESPGGGGAKEKPAPKKPKKAPAKEKEGRTPQEVANQNRASVAEQTGLGKDLDGAMARLAAGMGGQADEAKADQLVERGLAKKDPITGRYALSPEGRAYFNAAKKGDLDGARSAMGAGEDRAAGTKAKAQAKADKEQAAKEKAEAGEKAKADKEKEKKKGGGGGGGGGAKPEEKPAGEEEKDKADPKAKALAANRQKVVDAMADADEGLSPSGAKALLGFADGGKIDGEQAKGLAAMGLVEIDSKGGARLSAEGRAAAAAMGRGDTRGALDAISRAGDKAPKVAPPKPPEKKDPEFTRARKAVALPYGVGAYTIAKHGSHNQKTHGRATARRKAGRKEYAAARAQGADVATARQRAKDAGAARVAERDARAGRIKASKEQRAAAQAITVSSEDRGRLAREAGDRAEQQARQRYDLIHMDGGRSVVVDNTRRDSAGVRATVASGTPVQADRAHTSRVRAARTRAERATEAEIDMHNAEVRAGRATTGDHQRMMERINTNSFAIKSLSASLAKRAPSPLSAYAPISKADEGERLVYGVASTAIVDDQPGVWEGRRYDGDLVEPDAMREALASYWGNLRAMHEGAAGRALDVTVADDGNTYLVAKVTDDDAWRSVRERVYQGFSIGGRVLKAHLERVGGRLVRRITKLLLTEISLVDRPANPQAAILVYKRHPQGGDMADENETITTPPGEGGAALDALADLAGDDALAKAADPKRVISQIQELRNAAELEGDLEAAERYTQAIGLLLIAGGDVDAGDIDEDLAEEEEEAGVDLEALGAGEGDEEPVEAAKVLKSGRKIAASRMALLKSALMTYAKALADAGDEDAAKMLKALAPGDEPAADAETMKALVADELKKALGPADSGLQTVARAVLALGDQLKTVAGDVAKIAAQPVGGGPAIRLAPALAKRLGAEETAVVVKRADPDPTRQRAIYALEQRLATENNPTTRAQYQAELRKLSGE